MDNIKINNLVIRALNSEIEDDNFLIIVYYILK